MSKKYLEDSAEHFLSNSLIVLLLLFISLGNFDAVASDHVRRPSESKPAPERIHYSNQKHVSAFDVELASGCKAPGLYCKNQWPFENSDLHPDPGVVFKKLPNGFRYILMVNHHPKNRLSMHLFVKAGSLDESDAEQGLAHFLEHMMFDGSTHFRPSELVKFFQNTGMQFGPDANAHTGFNETVYDILLPKGDNAGLKDGLLVMKDFAQGALLLPSEVEKERRVVLAEKRTRDSASYRTYVAQLNFEFPDARISKRLPIGREEILKKVGQRQLKAFYDTWYRPEKMILILVGDFDPNSAAMLIGQQFSTIIPRAPPEKEPDLGDIDHKGIKAFYHFEKESGNTTVNIEILKKILPILDSYDFRRKQMMENFANRMVKHRLDALLMKPGTPFTSASIDSGIFLRQVKYADITADCDPKNWKRSLSAIEQVLRQALTFGFAWPELERVKKDLLSELDEAVNKASTRESGTLAREIISSLNANRVFMSPRQEKELYTPIINDVTLKDVNESFKNIWAADHRLLLVTGNATFLGKDPEDKILDSYRESMRVAVTRPAQEKAVIFPYLPEPKTTGRIIREKTIQDLGITEVDFNNGVRLNLKKTEFKADQVLVKIDFGRGRSLEPSGLPGLALLTENVINESGLGALEKDELERALAGKNTTVAFDVAEDRFSFEGETVSNEISLLFQLLYAHMVDPAFRKEAYDLSLKRFAQRYKTLCRSTSGAMELTGRRFLAGGNQRFGIPDNDTFKKLTLDNVRSWIAPLMKNNDIEVSVVGDFDVDTVTRLTARYFGSLPLHHVLDEPAGSARLKFPSGRSRIIYVQTKIPKGMIVVAYPTEDIWNISRTRRLSLLSEIVSDRLRLQIREKMGAAYSTYAFNRPSRAYPGYGVFQARVYVDPEQSRVIVDQVKEIVSGIAKDGITQDELNRAQRPVVTDIKDMLQKNNYWLDTVLSGSKIHPRQLQWSRSILEDYASITKESVTNVAKKYLKNDMAATIIVRPQQ
jgi:zinc protease